MNCIHYIIEYHYKLRGQWRWKVKGTLVWTYSNTEKEARDSISNQAKACNKWAYVEDISIMRTASIKEQL